MKTVNKIGAQGDLFFRRVSKIPDRVVEAKPENGQHIVAHSETGHHHLVKAHDTVYYRDNNDPMVCYLKVDAEYADIVHNRSFDTHETVRLTKGVWELRRQREHQPEGWRMVAD